MIEMLSEPRTGAYSVAVLSQYASGDRWAVNNK